MHAGHILDVDGHRDHRSWRRAAEYVAKEEGIATGCEGLGRLGELVAAKDEGWEEIDYRVGRAVSGDELFGCVEG